MRSSSDCRTSARPLKTYQKWRARRQLQVRGCEGFGFLAGDRSFQK